jgi:hypothetical protein
LEGESDPEEDEAGTTLNATLLTDKLRFSNHTVVKFKQTQKVAHIADMISQVKDNPTFIKVRKRKFVLDDDKRHQTADHADQFNTPKSLEGTATRVRNNQMKVLKKHANTSVG